MKEHFNLTLKWSRMLCEGVRHMAFVRADGAPLVYLPGQFIQIHFPWRGEELRRSYSIATIPSRAGRAEAPEVEIAVSYVEGGAATALLSAMDPGDSLDTTGPYGRFCLHDNEQPRRYVLVATGTGVTPYRAMLPEIARRLEGDTRVTLIQGARRRDEVLYWEEFVAFAAEHPGFDYQAWLSREMPAAPLPHERRGHVQDGFPALGPDPDSDIVYLCGNPDMIDDSVTRLKTKGFTVRNLRREKYVSNR